MASKANKGSPAPTASKKPVVRKSKTHDGRPSRAEKSAMNKAVRALDVSAAKEAETDVVNITKAAGKQATIGLTTKLAVQAKGGPVWKEPRVEWTEELSNALFVLISTGHSMREISEMDGMPPLFQMLSWLGEEAHPFVVCRTRAKDLLVPLYEEMAQHIAMNSNMGTITVERQVVTKHGDVVDTVETRHIDNVERSKLALQGIQWSLGHLKPKKHGRTPDQSSGTANEQLRGLFDALKAGPVDTN